MDKQRRKELLEQYKQIKTYFGMIQVKNLMNGKIFIAGYPNLKNKWPSMKAQLNMGRFYNLALQKDWTEYGEIHFEYEVLEEIVIEENTDRDWELKKLEQKWHDKLMPYGDKGYNKPL
ncbi:GIY-YIG nuclease family protein [Christensenellaceae bacterium OttesenSCG-928-M15]|nr:GIY-YIG nuclease family protein [Christensenellaceae bacterium OttesenSCG-928-M15]